MMEDPATRSIPRPEPAGWRALTRAALLSWDFLIGLVVGVALGALAAFSVSVEESLAGAMLAGSGVAAAIAALVLTAMTVLLATYSDAYKAMLQKVPGGVRGTLEPYRTVVVVASLASLAAFAVGLAQPLIETLAVGWRWAASALPLVLLAWAILGCVQTVNQLVLHVTNSEQAVALQGRRSRALTRPDRARGVPGNALQPGPTGPEPDRGNGGESA